MAYIGVSPSNGVRQKHTYTATASQTTFSGAGSEGVSLSYRDSNYVDVYRNGVKLGDADYTATSGTSIVLGEGAAVSDIIEIVTYDVFSVADTVSKADGGTFDGNVAMAGTLAVTGATTLSSNLSVDGGTIKLDGNYPVGTDNVALGDTALDSLTSGSNNTAIGSSALTANTTASNNTAVGYQALYSNNAVRNTAIGYNSLRLTVNDDNTAVGAYSLESNTSGYYNVGMGYLAGNSNTTGTSNVAIGTLALRYNTTASNNTAVGFRASENTTGTPNTSLGSTALLFNTTGSYNVGIGGGIAGSFQGALTTNTTGSYNTAVGVAALGLNTTASQNTAVGYQAGYSNTGASNTFLGTIAGYNATTGSSNIFIGYNATPASVGDSGELVIGVNSTGKGSNTGYIVGNGNIYQGNNSSSWATTSDQRLKKNIVDNTEGLEKINALRVRNFEYRLPEEVDPELKPSDAIQRVGIQLGVIAQELQQVCPDCVKEESTGVLSVDSDNMTWYLVNAVKELSAQITELQSEIAILKGE